MRIYSKVDGFYVGFVAVFSLFLVFLIFHAYYSYGFRINANVAALLFIVLGCIGLFLVLPKLTYLEFCERELKCCTLLFISKKIPYNSITRLERSKSIYAGLKFTTSLKGIVLHFGKFDDVLIGPRDEELFVKELLARNKTIHIEI